MESYRVFISYSRQDVRLAEGIVAVLEKNGLRPVWDRNLRGG